MVIPGRCVSIEPGISRFRVWSYGPSRNDRRSDQILLRDDFAQPGIVGDEFLNEFMHAMLENVVHIAVFQPVADAAGMPLGRALAAIGDPDLIEIAHEVAVAARQ